MARKKTIETLPDSTEIVNNESNKVEPKKRGRKPKKAESDDSAEKPVPKKRGRKPKYDKSAFSEFPDWVKENIVPVINNNIELIKNAVESAEIVHNDLYTLTAESWLKVSEITSSIAANVNKYSIMKYAEAVSRRKKTYTTIEMIRECMHIKSIKSILSMHADVNELTTGNLYLIYSHLALLIEETNTKAIKY